MPFGVPDLTIPASFELPRLREDPGRAKRLANLKHEGRVKGVQNKICRDLKEGLLQSAILHGYDGAGEGGLIGFCLHLAERHPKIHGGLLAKLLPYNLNANVAGSGISTVNILGVPSGVHLTREQIERTRQGQPLTLDAEQMAQKPAAAEPIEQAIVDIPDISPDLALQESEEATIRALTAEIRKLSQKLVIPVGV
jgi:hypothetical protein